MTSTEDCLTASEWSELLALKEEISFNIAAVHPDQLAQFSKLFARTLRGKGNPVHLSHLETSPK